MNAGRARTACLLFFIYTGLALLFTYPLALNLGTHHIGDASGDAKVYLWNYWWVGRALLELGTSPFQTDAIFHPIGIGLSLHTLALAQGVVAAPLAAVFGSVVAANLVVLWSFIASALASFALARRLGASTAGSFLAGLAFAFCPYRLARLAGHYDLLGTEWIPLYALLLIELCERERFSAWLSAGAGLVAAILGYTSLTYLAFVSLFTAVFLIYHFRRLATLVPRCLALSAVLTLALSPLLFHAFSDLSMWSYPRYPGADRYVADALGYVVPPAQQTLVPGVSFSDNVTETTVFPGFALLALAAFGTRHRLWAVTAFVFFVLSLGSSLHIAGSDTGLPMPFRLVSAMPLLEHLRAPSRLAILVVLALAMMAALAWSPRKRMWTIVPAAVIVAEYLSVPVPLFSSTVPDVYRLLAESPSSAAVVEIPGIDQAGAELMHHQRVHGKPIFMGFAARVPTEKSEYWLGLPLVRPLIELRKDRLTLGSELMDAERKNAPAVARFLNIGWFVIDKAFEKRGVTEFVKGVLPVEPFFEDDERVVLRVTESELPPHPATIEAGAPVSRQHFESGWMTPELDDGGGFRWAHRKRSTLLFRPPPGSREVILEIAPLEDMDQSVQVQLDGVSLGSVELRSGWQDVRWTVPETDRALRMTLEWSDLRTASDRDPRPLAARVRRLRFE